MALKIYESNKLEVLASKCAETIKKNPPLSHFSIETLLVQTPGMERWLSIELARINGSFASFQFLTPASLSAMAAGAVFAERTDRNPFGKKVFLWSIMKALDGGLMNEPGFERIRDYVDGSQLKLYQLSAKISDVFDQYAVYRPALTAAWESGDFFYSDSSSSNYDKSRELELWQGRLWREVISMHPEFPSRAVLIEKLLAADYSGKELPERISVFGISVLPEFYVALLEKLSKAVPVYMYLMNPCRYYWGDIRPDRESARFARRLKKKNADVGDYHFEQGNPLLASMGKTGRNFFSNLYKYEIEESLLFEDNRDNGTILSRLQQSILDMEDPASEEGFNKYTVDPEDNTVRLLSCHGPMREAEVLHDYLLGLFNRDSSLRPKDVLVLTPDINGYAPFIDAVFANQEDGKRFPYTIADRSVRAENRAADVFVAVLELCESRLELSRVISLLEAPQISARFGISEGDIALVRDAAYEAGIRWGADDGHLKETGLSEPHRNTWRAGIERIILGYAADSGDRRLYRGIYPLQGIDGDRAAVLGRFLHFADELIDITRSASASRSIQEWKHFLLDIAGRLFDGRGENQEGVDYVIRQITFLDQIEALSGFDSEVEFAVIKNLFSDRFEELVSGRGFIRGGITFCSMLPLRSIPFRVICMMGMNDGDFPKRSTYLGFDLLALNPEPGDRNPRESDRYLFLESVLSARERLCITYTGQSPRDNSMRLPSAVVDELLNCIKNMYELDDTLAPVAVSHRMQAFSPDYFSGEFPELRSFRSDLCPVVSSIQSVKERELPPLRELSSTPEIGELNISHIREFFHNPSRYLLMRQLGVYFPLEEEKEEDVEPLEEEPLAVYSLQESLIRDIAAGEEPSEALYRSAGILPSGAPGGLLFRKSLEESARIVEAFRNEIAGSEERVISATLNAGKYSIGGIIRPVYGDKIVRFRPAKVKVKDRISLWIDHLFACAAGNECESVFIGKDGAVRYKPVKNASGLLEELAGLFALGCGRALAFFPETSFVYASKMISPSSRTCEDAVESAALKAAEVAWQGNLFATGEAENPYITRLFKGVSVEEIYREFSETAMKVFEPVIRHEEEAGR